MPERSSSPSQAALEAAEELDLEAQVDALLDEVDQAIARVLQRRDPNFGLEPGSTDLSSEAASFVSGGEQLDEFAAVEVAAEPDPEVEVEVVGGDIAQAEAEVEAGGAAAVEAEPGGVEEEDLATSLMSVRDEASAPPPPSEPIAPSVPAAQRVPPVADVPGPMAVAGGGAGAGSGDDDLGAGIDQLLDDLDGDMRTAGEIRAVATEAPAGAGAGAGPRQAEGAVAAAAAAESNAQARGGAGGDAVDRQLERLMADPGVAAATRRPMGAIDRDLSQFRDVETIDSIPGGDGGALEGSYESVEAVGAVESVAAVASVAAAGAGTAKSARPVLAADPTSGERAAFWAARLWSWLRVGLRWAGRCLAVGLTRLEPIAARGVELSAAPLAKQPAVVRSAVGWVGLYTLFLAAVVWAWVLVFREAKTPAAPGPAVTLLEKPAE